MNTIFSQNWFGNYVGVVSLLGNHYFLNEFFQERDVMIYTRNPSNQDNYSNAVHLDIAG